MVILAGVEKIPVPMIRPILGRLLVIAVEREGQKDENMLKIGAFFQKASLETTFFNFNIEIVILHASSDDKASRK